MKNTRRITTLLMALILCIGFITFETGVQAFAEDNSKPTIKWLRQYSATDLKEYPLYDLFVELGGYDVDFTYLPSTNANERLMLELSSGVPYDLVYVQSMNAYLELKEKNVLMDLTDLLEEYGQDILETVPAEMWEVAKNSKGEITGIPVTLSATLPSKDSLYSWVLGVLVFRMDVMEEYGLEIPTNLEELYDALYAFTEATGKPGLTIAKGKVWLEPVLSAFGLYNSKWYTVDDEIVPRVYMDGLVDYVEFMQKLYRENLLDNDFPINESQNSNEKFISGDALCTYSNVTGINTVGDGVSLMNPDTYLDVAYVLSKDADSKATMSFDCGYTIHMCIPKNAEHPKEAMEFYNAISQYDNFKRIYIGEEGVSYEVRDGQYYPIFPAFNDYSTANNFVGSLNPTEQRTMWMARVRKNELMARVFETANSHTEDYLRNENYSIYASILPAYQEYIGYLDTLMDDLLLKGIAGEEDAQTVVNGMRAAWDENGGAEVVQEINAWWEENKTKFE